MKLRFYKEDNHWYVDLPDWKGTKAELEMVDGADTMLDHISKGKNETCLNISEQLIDGYDLLTLKEKYEDDQLGAFYHIEYFGNEKVDMEMWLCPVMLYVFGQYPERIYLSESC